MAEWPAYGMNPGGSRYSPLVQITRDNVKHLTVAWTYRTGDVSDGSGDMPRSSFQATPIVVDGTLYLSTFRGRVIALDPETGHERWTFDPHIPGSRRQPNTASRGVSTWLDPDREAGAPCRRRIFLATLDARLIALDATSGTLCRDFGEGGQLDLRKGVGQLLWEGEYKVTSPPAVINGLVVVGSAIADNVRVNVPRGIVRAFDARSGALRWSWDPIPRDPADPARSTWKGESASDTGGANAWAPLSADPERDLVFVPTSSPSPDHYGGERLGSNLYANAVVALRASTGEVAWSFQTVHHDLWDYDVPAQPTLVALRRAGVDVPAVVQATKMGHLFVLHRDTGEPLFPVEERPVPQTTVPGEETWPTQPFPTRPPPLHPQRLIHDDAWGVTFWDRGKCRARIAALRSEGIFTPPSLEGSVIFPGLLGGTNWGGVAFDPERQLLLVNSTRIASVVTLVPREKFAAVEEATRGRAYAKAFPQAGDPIRGARGWAVFAVGDPV
jgi:quinoprotein glucose dehydrogenase